MSLPQPVDDPDVAPVAVVIGRSIGGVVLVIAGIAVLAGTGFLLFVAPFLGGAFPDWSGWLEDLYWVPAAIGLGLVVWGATMVRRARKRSIDQPIDPNAVAAMLAAADPSSGAAGAVGGDEPPNVGPAKPIL